MPTSDAAPPTVRRAVGGKAIAAATVGNLLEIYDFISYGMFAVPISTAFFPAGNDTVALLLTFVTFGMGFLARPLGALVIGSYADRHGRKGAFSVTILMMAVGTAVIAFCPTYARIGLAAPVLVTLGRILQGFSAGAEVGGAVAILIENAPPQRRGFFAALQQLSQGSAVLATGIVGVALTTLFTQAEIMAGAWRIVFMVGLLIAPLGVYIRLRLDETPAFLEERRHGPARPTVRILAGHLYPVFIGILVMILWTVATYISNYFTTYSVREIHLSLSQSYLGQISYGIVMLVVCPLAGRLTDAIGRSRCLLLGAVGIGVVAYPAFRFLIDHPGLGSLCLAQSAIAVFLALYASTASTVLGELFPTAVRATGVSLSYSAGVTIFGGFTPAVITALLAYSGNKMAIAYYLIGAAVVSAIPIVLAGRQGTRAVA